jgi:energy-coupling factor transporter ATP-binding protein EcfA2
MSKLNNLNAQCSRLEGVRDVLVSQKASLIMSIDKAQSYLDTKDEVLSVLTAVQESTQAKTKDLFENLLSSLIKEVLGERDENAKVVLSSTTKNNKVSLAVEIENSSGERRDVYLDKGGSIKNIVAMGLRFIALSRTTNRRFIVLDEADCWLNEKYIKGFASILHDLSVKIGMQVIYISHHSPEHFFSKAKVINLTNNNGIICSEEVEQPMVNNDSGKFENSMEDSDVDALMDGVGVRYLRLMNFKQHENTVIELSPNVTVITGDNDVGKTTVVQAIEAVARNSGREGIIRDGMASCKVELGLEDGFCLEWSYKRKGSNKTHYLLTDSTNTKIKESKSGTLTPEWLDQYLCMPLHKEIDINIGDQDSANFILDKSISGFKKAEILSLGTDASKIQKLITKHGENVLNCTKLINSKKKELLSIKNQLSCLGLLNSVTEKLRASSEIDLAVKANQSALDKMRSLCGTIKTLTETQSIMAPVRAISIPRLAVDTDNAAHLERIIGNTTRLQKEFSAISKIERISRIESPEVAPANDVFNIAVKIKELSTIQAVLGGINNIRIGSHEMLDSSEAERLGVTISINQKEHLRLSGTISASNRELASIQGEKKILISELGSECPLCESKIMENMYESV